MTRPEERQISAETRIGKLAAERGWVTQEDVDRLVTIQQSMCKSNVRKRLGQLLLMHDLISANQLKQLLKQQEALRSGAV